MKKLITALLAAVLVCAQLSACSEDSGTADKQKTGESDTAVDSTGEETVINWESSGLPRMNFDGESFTFLYCGEQMEHAWRQIDVESIDGDLLNDAIYNRNRKIEALYNVNIDAAYIGDREFQNTATRSITSGDKAYDVLFGYAHVLMRMSQEGQLLNYYNMPYIDTDAVWWDKSAVDGLTVSNKLYLCTGDISPLTNARVFSLVFNKDMCSRLNLELPYQYVLDGTWTLEVFNRYISDVNDDVDGNSEMDYNDRWGFMSQKGNSWMMYFAGGGRVVEKSSDDKWSISFDSDRNVTLAMEALAISTDATKTLMADQYVANNGGSWAAASNWFASGGSMMRSSVFEPVPRDYRAMETDFGVLPYPKLDESQDRYYTCPEVASYMLSFPVTCNPELTGIIVESLAVESVSTVSEAFYEVCLNEKAVRDEESKQILDIIFDSKVFDIGYILDFGGFCATVRSVEDSGTTEVASALRKIQRKAASDLEKLLEKYEGLE